MSTYNSEPLVKMLALLGTSWKNFDATEKQAIDLLSWTIQKIGNNHTLLMNREYWRSNFGRIDTRLSVDKTLISFCYTKEIVASHEKWNSFERACRGIVFETISGNIIARPFSKFFNVDQDIKNRDPEMYINYCARKEDGMLVIAYYYNGQWNANTKKTFNHPEAQEWLDKMSKDDWHKNCTYMFELCVPSTRQVVHYDPEQDGLYLLAMRDIHYGDYLEQRIMDGFTQFKRPQNYDYITLAEVREEVEKLHPHEQEGFVIHYVDGIVEKVKSKKYFELHRLLSKVTIRNLQQAIFKLNYDIAVKDGENVKHLTKYLAGLPDYSLGDLYNTIPAHFLSTVCAMYKLIWEDVVCTAIPEIERIYRDLPKENRKEFAKIVLREHKKYAPSLFAKLDGKNYELLYLMTQEYTYDVQVPVSMSDEQ